MVETEIIKLEDIQVGDYVPGTKGHVMVSRVYETHLPEKMYELTFEGKKGVEKKIEASGNHLWYVETSLDKSLHKKRLKEGKKVFSQIKDENVVEMLKILEIEDKTEIGLNDVVNLVEAYNDTEMVNHLIRIAESIGPVADEKKTVQEMGTGEIFEEQTVRLYDGHQFIQQIMSFIDKKFSKNFPIIVGKVLTTNELVDLVGNIEINIPEVS